MEYNGIVDPDYILWWILFNNFITWGGCFRSHCLCFDWSCLLI